MMNISVTPDPRWVKLGLLFFLQKLDVLDLEKRAVTHMMQMVSMSSPGVVKVIPDGAIVFDVTGLNIEYVVPCKRGQGNWPAR